MHIDFVEIANFRKLLSVRIDISETTTLFVGANNSGKTSAMSALQKFLSPSRIPFDLYDFPLCHWSEIDAIGQRWIEARAAKQPIEFSGAEWAGVVPALDLWLYVEPGEFHHVRDILPTLDWAGGKLGVRMRFEPSDTQGLPSEGRNALFNDFLAAHDAAESVRAAATKAPSLSKTDFTVWPTSLSDFLRRHLTKHFKIRVYLLDPAAIKAPEGHEVCLQTLAEDSLPVEGNPLSGLIRVNDIPAQRGFADTQPSNDDEYAAIGRNSTRLSEQLRSYYKKHLDPTDRPHPDDLEALQAIEFAQNAFDQRLTNSFAGAFGEVEKMGYPGVTDPRPKISTRLKVTDGLDHAAAVSFEVDAIGEDGSTPPALRLPEDHNGLGYQNLISMTFLLMRFRDAWMHVGKAAKPPGEERFEPLHLVLIEEPEAHLHAQVQQVFINNAYAILRNRPNLGTNKTLCTQLIVSTHSSHIAHEVPFDRMRYFRRLPAGMPARMPVATVINLSNTFGSEKDTERFVTRYLRAQHADLFFADAAILVEGPAERMLLPNFVRAKHAFLNHCFVTILEIGGSHAHRLRSLIEKLELLTLVVTDLDSLDPASHASVQPAPGAKQVTGNATLKTWLPELSTVDELYAVSEDKKTRLGDELFAVRVAFQMPLGVVVPKPSAKDTAYPYTFEDALAFENLAFFKTLEGGGLVAKFRNAITEGATAAEIGKAMWDALKTGKKAEFALDIIDTEKFDDLNVPAYINEGLEWLETRLRKKQREILLKPPAEDGKARGGFADGGAPDDPMVQDPPQ